MTKLTGFWLATALSTALTYAADPIPKSPTDGPMTPTVTIKAVQPVTADLGKKCIVSVETTAKKVTWKYPAGVDAVSLTADNKSVAVWALPGSYTLSARVPSGDDVIDADVLVTIAGDVGPVLPVSTLKADVLAAFGHDPSDGLTKAALAVKLAKLYRASASDTFLKKYGATTTWYEVFTDVATANSSQMGQTDLQGVRVVISKYLDARLPTDKATKLDPKLAAAEFGNVAAALEALTK